MTPAVPRTRRARCRATPGLLAVMVLVSGCARRNPAIITTALCAPPVPGPSSWREVPVPKSPLKVRLPQSYALKEGTWRSEEASIAFNWHPHQPPEHEDPGQGGPHAPECSVRLADRTVWFKRWIAISPSGTPYYITVATWEEAPGTDIEITASARDTYQQREQVKVIYSLHP
jgi:hypothetical protein